jgi:hypothetical protein
MPIIFLAAVSVAALEGDAASGAAAMPEALLIRNSRLFCMDVAFPG